MDNQTVLEEKEYMELYNKGYGLHRFSPEMAELMSHANSNDPRLEPLKAGIGKSIEDVEIEKDYTPDWLKEDRFKENANDITQDLEKDYEPGDE